MKKNNSHKMFILPRLTTRWTAQLFLGPVLAILLPGSVNADAPGPERSAVSIPAVPSFDLPETEDTIAVHTTSTEGFAFQVQIGEEVGDEGKVLSRDGRNMDIDVQFDALDTKKTANLVILDGRTRDDEAARGLIENTYLVGFWNYVKFSERAEVRIFGKMDSTEGPAQQIIPITYARAIPFSALNSELRGSDLKYVLRIYGDGGTFDETEPRLFGLSSDGNLTSGAVVDTVGESWDVDALSLSNVSVSGAAVTVFGKNIPEDHRAKVMGFPVPVSPRGDFIVKQIMPSGANDIAISVLNTEGQGLEISRNIYIPEDKFFYVALGDLTIGSSERVGPADIIGEASEYEDIEIDGRVALFAHGKIKGDVLLTLMVDTGEEKLEDIFNNLDEKDPRSLLQRIDPDGYYPVYGDSSNIEEMSLSEGKFYVRLAKGKSHILWGNFRTEISGRAFYGAQIRLVANETTSFGAPRYAAEAYIAQPGTLPQVDEFQGTGGSVYFLDHQDIKIGTENVHVVVRDATTGVELTREKLVAGKDYDIDYLQGRVLLSYPLSENVSDSFIVDLSGDIDEDDEDDHAGYMDHPAYLSVSYEYTPRLRDVGDKLAYGASASGWLGDTARIGVRAIKDDTDSLDLTEYSVDATVRMGTKASITGNYSSALGRDADRTLSKDGGYTCEGDAGSHCDTSASSYEKTDDYAASYDVKATADLKQFGISGGKASAYYKHTDAGYKASKQEDDSYGVSANLPVGDTGINLSTSLSRSEQRPVVGGMTTRDRASLDLKQNIGSLSAGLGLGYARSDSPDKEAESAAVGGNLSYKIKVSEKVSASVNASTNILRSDRIYDKNAKETTKDVQENFTGAKLGASVSVQASDSLSLGASTGYSIDDEEISAGVNANYTLPGEKKRQVGFSADVSYVEAEVEDKDTGKRYDVGTTDLDLEVSYKHSDRTSLYLGYNTTLSDYMGEGVSGSLLAGARTVLNDRVSLTAEQQFGLTNDDVTKLTNNFGINYNPNRRVNFKMNTEVGNVSKEVTDKETNETKEQDFRRLAISGAASYVHEGLSASASVAYRMDESENAPKDIMAGKAVSKDSSILTRASVGYKISDVLSSSAKISLYIAEKNEDLRAGNYIDGTLGLTYRPIDNDKLLALLKYRFYSDLPDAEDGSANGYYKQRSHIVSADGNYQINKYLSVGAKYALKFGERTLEDMGDDFYSSTVHLGIIRGNLHVVKNWDALLEGRIMHQNESEQTRYGALAGIYRHMGDNFKIGAGYNFSKFSDDLTNVEADASGWFVNAVAKF